MTLLLINSFFVAVIRKLSFCHIWKLHHRRNEHNWPSGHPAFLHWADPTNKRSKFLGDLQCCGRNGVQHPIVHPAIHHHLTTHHTATSLGGGGAGWRDGRCPPSFQDFQTGQNSQACQVECFSLHGRGDWRGGWLVISLPFINIMIH